MTIVIPARAARDVKADYREFAKSGDLAALNGRFDLDYRTDDMVAVIMRHLDFAPGQRILDVGCGDARLLRSLLHASYRAGTVLTEEEKARLIRTPELKGIDFFSGAFHELPAVISSRFDRVIVNSSLPNVGSRAAAMKALGAIANFVKPGGKLWLGELFSKPTPAEKGRRCFNSKREALIHVWRKHGFFFTAKFARHIARHWSRADQIIEITCSSGPWWIVRPEELQEIAKRLGLIVEGVWDCEEETADPFYAISGRFSVLLNKP